MISKIQTGRCLNGHQTELSPSTHRSHHHRPSSYRDVFAVPSVRNDCRGSEHIRQKQDRSITTVHTFMVTQFNQSCNRSNVAHLTSLLIHQRTSAKPTLPSFLYCCSEHCVHSYHAPVLCAL